MKFLRQITALAYWLPSISKQILTIRFFIETINLSDGHIQVILMPARVSGKWQNMPLTVQNAISMNPAIIIFSLGFLET